MAAGARIMHPAAARHLERPLQYARWWGRGGIARCPPIPIYGAQRALVWSPILHDWQFQPKLDGARNRNEPAARYGSSPDSPLERTGFELLVPRGDGPRWVSLQLAVASRLSQQDCHAASSKISGE